MRPPVLTLHSLKCGACVTEVCDRTFPLVWANPTFERVTGYTADDLEGRDPWFLHTGLCKEAEVGMKRLVTAGYDVRGIIQIQHADGRKLWVEVTGRRAEIEGRVRLFGMVSDWTPEWQRRLETLSPRQERTLSLIGNGISIGETSRIMEISEHSVRNYRAEIHAKLRIETLADLYLLRAI